MSNQRPYGRETTPNSAMPSNARPQSAFFPQKSPQSVPAHGRNKSFSPSASIVPLAAINNAVHRTTSTSHNSQSSGTFAPQFIKQQESQSIDDRLSHIEGENDFSGKRYVWLKDPQKAFVKGWIVEDQRDGRLLVQCEDGSQRTTDAQSVDKVNPAKFDKASDMAELTFLNEASVVHNLYQRYQSDLIYTYSGLFLVAVNPYCPLPIYSRDYVNMYRGRNREDTKPHIFAVADEAFRNLVDEGENQSILVTGESGAGKTENTKKVIHYLAAVATCDSPRPSSRSSNKASLSNLSQQILRANPILEAFGNAQTLRNNNSSRFGKFIRIEFTRPGQIAGAFIDWYLLEKSRVVRPNANERSYHIFYQILAGADSRVKKQLLLDGCEVGDFDYLKHGNDAIPGVSDQEEWIALLEAFEILGFSEVDQNAILRTVAAVLHLGNISLARESQRADQASLEQGATIHAQRACQLLGIPLEPFLKALLHPQVKAGREWVEKVQTPSQVRSSIDALSKGIYERGFGNLVDLINQRLNKSTSADDDTHFIGVLDIAGFEIFENNSFEQLCINYTNEKLQQFFNHHMFVLEQEEYAREQIEWKFIDFGKDLQPTIDLIEVTNPIGIFSCLDEDSVMPKATDKSFTEKLHSLWDRKTPKYKRSMLTQGFMLTHYAAEVEYSTDGWLEKNKDPLNDNVTRLLAASSVPHIAQLFGDCAYSDDVTTVTRNRVKKGLFRTVAQRHKEQLSGLMSQLHATHPHFVRCIIPNHKKRPKIFDTNLVLDQLRCNGVLEGIRIARTGFPNRIPFAEFRSRYEVLCKNMPKGYLEGREAAAIILQKLNLDRSIYRVGLTKVFFRAGVLAELEEQRDNLIKEIMCRFQSVARGFTVRRAINKKLYRAEAARIIHQNFQVYLNLQSSPWWRLFVRMRPLLGATRQTGELKKREEMIHKLEVKMEQNESDRKKLDEDRRKAENEIAKVTQVLESERALALDKEEIFKRLQDREVELSEKLAGALDDQDGLEDQIDELMLARKKAEERVATVQRELQQAVGIIGACEEEKKDLTKRLAEADRDMLQLKETRYQSSEAEERLQRELRVLGSQLAMKDRKVQDLEGRSVKADQDQVLKLSETTKELNTSRKQLKQLSDENRHVREQLDEVSSTSTGFDDILRAKDSELSILKSEINKYEADRRSFDEQNRKISMRHDDIQDRLRNVQAELEATRARTNQLEREANDAKEILKQRLDEDSHFEQNQKVLAKQIEDLKNSLFTVQADLSKEQQSHNEVQMLSEHNLTTLRRDYDDLNQAKITIEKELYAQQDILRRTSDGKIKGEQERRDLQQELRHIRQRFLELQETKVDAQSEAERSSSRLAIERQAALRQDLEDKYQRLGQAESECRRLNCEIQNLKGLIADSELYKTKNEQHQERVERELVTVKGRLTASENDNRALLNKVQQKNLDIARSNSRAGDSQRSRMTQLQNEKTKKEEENKALCKQLEEARLALASLEKQKDKLALNVEDLNHEVNRGHQTSRNAEKTASAATLQVAEVNRKLETERQMKNQAQNNTRTVQSALDRTNEELSECHKQLMLLQKIFDPNTDVQTKSYEAMKPAVTRTVDLARKLEAAERAAHVATENCARAEAQVETLRSRHEDEINEIDVRHTNSKRALLEEIDPNQVNSRTSPQYQRRSQRDTKTPERVTPTPRYNGHQRSDSARSDMTADSTAYNKKMDLVSELELVQNQLQMSEMKNRHLQNRIDQSPSKQDWLDDSPSVKRIQRLERENFRLHDALDDSSQKVSALENSMRSGQLTLQDVQTKSHEELYDILNSQEQSRRTLLQAHNTMVADLAESKEVFDAVKRAKASVEVEARDARSELQEMVSEREQEQQSRSQLLQEFAELQIKLDTEVSNYDDVKANMELYKTRADEYYNKLEQAEIAVLKASRAEHFAKGQSREAEDTYANVIADRKESDALVEDLRRQIQGYEERVEDMSADLDGALQARKRLHNELEDYRSQRAIDLEDQETSVEQTRRKYQNELAALHEEFEIERENVVAVRGENSRLRDELEELRSKWDEEVVNSSTWSKEKSRLEMALQGLTNSRDEAAEAHNEAQSKVVSLLSQVRSLRTSVDDVTAERDAITKEKKTLDSRLRETSERLEDLSRSGSPSMRNVAGTDRELLRLKTDLAQKEDIASAAVGKMRRSEALAQEIQKELAMERETNVQLHREKATMDRQVKDLQLKMVDLDTKGYSSGSRDVRFLNGRVHELESQLENLESTRNKEARSVRNVDRTVRDLQSQLERREKANAQISDDISKSREKMDRLFQTIDELQTSESSSQLQAKRAERDLREEKEKGLRLERELEGWKGLRVERESLRRSGTWRALSEIGAGETMRSRREGSAPLGPSKMQGPSIPERMESLTKTFL